MKPRFLAEGLVRSVVQQAKKEVNGFGCLLGKANEKELIDERN